MGTHDHNYIVSGEKTPIFTVRWNKNRATPFVFQWRAFQHDLAFKSGRLDCFSTETFEIAIIKRRIVSRVRAAASRLGKSRMSHLIAS